MFFCLALTVLWGLGPAAFAQVAPGRARPRRYRAAGWVEEGETMAMTTLKTRLGAPGDRAVGRADAQTAKDRFVAANKDWVSTVQQHGAASQAETAGMNGQRQARAAQPLFRSHTLKRQGAASTSPY